MPVIQFDVLVPRADQAPLEDRFHAALDVLLASERMTRAALDVAGAPHLAEGLEDQLRATYRDEHDGEEMEDATVVRYAVTVEGLTGSVNQLTMALSRLLTPQAQLPADRVLLENERSYELPARYPWAVDIVR